MKLKQKVEEILDEFKSNLDTNLAGDGKCLERQDNYFALATEQILQLIEREVKMKNKETGEQIEDNDFSRMQLRKLGSPIGQCQHCYCVRVSVNKQEHFVCCMCGHRTLVNRISY